MHPLDIGLLFIHRLLHIHTERLLYTEPQLSAFIEQHLFTPLYEKSNFLSSILHEMKDRDICHVTDPLGVRLSLILVEDNLCILGPYKTESLSAGELKQRFTEIKLAENLLPRFQSYVQLVPLLPIDDILSASHTLMQTVTGLDSKAVVYYVNMNVSNYTRLLSDTVGAPLSSTPIQLFTSVVSVNDNLDLLYQLETTLAEQMTNGQTSNALLTLAKLESLHDQDKSLDSAKLNSAVLCAQMRQIAVQADVLPTSAEITLRYFLALIHSATSVGELSQIHRVMLAQFCDLIRKEHVNSHDPKIRQILQLIMADLSGNLSVEALAAQVNLSPNYISSRFKKEMGQSLSSYIRDKRLESATRFLAYTNMPIRDIALCVGITDFSYFTKIFHEKYGMTPSKYRRCRGNAQ